MSASRAAASSYRPGNTRAQNPAKRSIWAAGATSGTRQWASAARSSSDWAAAAAGTVPAPSMNRARASSVSRPIPSSSVRRRTVAGPTPSMVASTRCQASTSAGLSRMRSSASRSLTWADSRYLRPPYLT